MNTPLHSPPAQVQLCDDAMPPEHGFPLWIRCCHSEIQMSYDGKAWQKMPDVQSTTCNLSDRKAREKSEHQHLVLP